MFQKLLTGAGVFAGLFLFTIATVGISIQACSPGQLHQEEVQPKETTITVETDDPCTNTTKFSVSHCVIDGEFDMWYGLWEECFNNACQTSWAPALGIMCIRCSWPICEAGFQWRTNDFCHVPEEYNWEVSTSYSPAQGQFWEGKLTFPPDECLAEEVNNCHHFTIYGADCPY